MTLSQLKTDPNLNHLSDDILRQILSEINKDDNVKIEVTHHENYVLAFGVKK